MPTKVSNIFLQVLKDYTIQTTLHGYQYLSEPGRHWIERVMWTAVHIGTTSCLIIVVYGMYVDYFHQLPVTTLKSIHHPIQEIPYPAVAICDINKLRKSKTLELASQLYAEYNVPISEERFGELLRYLGLLYDQSEQINSETVVRELDQVLKVANITLNITDVMRKLSTPCEDILIKCLWEGKEEPCKEIFRTRKTMEGFCCTFNYIRPTDNFNPTLLTTKAAEDPETSPTSGAHMGLTVLVRSNLSDYYYPTIPIIGLKVLIFNPYDYPDTASGGLTELLVTMQKEVFFSMRAVTTEATTSVHGLDLERRSCFFTSDIEEKFGELYSYSDCMMDCRIDDIRRKCGCLPFYSPSREETPICGVENIHCLLIHRDFWQTMRPLSISPQETVTGANFCPSPCYPTCTSTLYTVQSSIMPLSRDLINKSTVFPTVDIEDHSLLHIYFGSARTPLMMTDVLTTWFELLSNIGGVCGALIGFSLMSIIEFVYFFTVRLAFEVFNKNRPQRVVKLADSRSKATPAWEKGSNTTLPRAPKPKKYGWAEIYHKSTGLPEVNGYNRRVLGRPSDVEIFWNEISFPKNSSKPYDDVLILS